MLLDNWEHSGLMYIIHSVVRNIESVRSEAYIFLPCAALLKILICSELINNVLNVR